MWYNHNFMKIHYNVKTINKTFDLDTWIKSNQPEMMESTLLKVRWYYQHYLELIDEFRDFLNSKEAITDEYNQILTPIDIYDAINSYKIRIEKLWLIFGIRLYKTHNVNKDTNTRYIVIRTFWIDDFGKKYRKFSKNLGAEDKVLVRGVIPKGVMDSVEDYMLTVMTDLYYFEYLSDEAYGIDSEGNLFIPED